MPRGKLCICVCLSSSVTLEGWQTLRGLPGSPHALNSYALLLCGSKVDSVFKVKFQFDRKSTLPGETSPFWWRQTPLCRLHKDKLLGKSSNPLLQWCNSLDFNNSKEFGYRIILCSVVDKIPVAVIIIRRDQLKALWFFGKVLSPLDLIFLGLVCGLVTMQLKFLFVLEIQDFFFQCMGWIILPSAIKKIWNNKQKIIPAHNFLLWAWNYWSISL